MEEFYIPYMLYEEVKNAKYGSSDYTYSSLDGRLRTYYNTVERTTYYEELYKDLQHTYSKYTYYNAERNFNITEERDSKYGFYARFD